MNPSKTGFEKKRETVAPGIVKTIDSVSNPTIKSIRGLVSQRKHRKESGLFVAEGLKLATDALDANWTVQTLIYGHEVREQEAVSQTAAKTRARGGTVLEVSRQVLSSITRRDNPQMVVGVYKQKTLSVDEIKPAEYAIWIGLDTVRDPGNLGTIIRTADAVGAAGVVLIGETTDPFAVEAVRATMGSVFHVPIAKCSREQFKKWIVNWPGQVAGTHLNGAVDYRTVKYDGPCFLLMGNEQAGLPDDMADTCKTLVRIPQAGQADSLNLAIATGVMLFEICRERLKL
ncbi:MAG: RNA methyltransferase [Stappiaceae bacterium]